MQEVAESKQPLILKIFPKDGKFVLSLKQNYTEHLPTISKQCTTMLYAVYLSMYNDAIFMFSVCVGRTNYKKLKKVSNRNLPNV